MNVVIIEDEPLAAEKLSRYLQKGSKDIKILEQLGSLDTAIPWIKEHGNRVDLYFMDVQLTDGLSFEIFEQVMIQKPVIFTTSFDEYAIDAFKVNSIDYLLKPITFTDVTRALKKLESLQHQFSHAQNLKPLIHQISKKSYKNRFLVKVGNHIKSIPTEEIMAFFADGRDVSLWLQNGKEYLIEYTLETLEELLDPKTFFRVNRSFIVSLRSIRDVMVYSNRRLKLSLDPAIKKEIVVSREKVGGFKKWFGDN